LQVLGWRLTIGVALEVSLVFSATIKVTMWWRVDVDYNAQGLDGLMQVALIDARWILAHGPLPRVTTTPTGGITCALL
jgi:hypothetical protein